MGLIGVVAVDRNMCIGKDGKIPWHCKEDLKFFKNLTLNNIIVMGRKTWDKLPIKPLPNRLNIIMSHKLTSYTEYQDNLDKGIIYQSSIMALYVNVICQNEHKKTFIIGGLSIYNLFKDHIDEFYVSYIDVETKDGDTFLPKDYFNSFSTNTIEDISNICKVHHLIKIKKEDV